LQCEFEDRLLCLAFARLEHPTLGLPQGRKIRRLDLSEAVLKRVERRCDPACRGAQGRSPLVQGSGLGASGVAQERFAARCVHHGAVRVEESHGFPGAEPMAKDGLIEPQLGAAVEATEAAGDGEPEPSLVQTLRELGGEPAREEETP